MALTPPKKEKEETQSEQTEPIAEVTKQSAPKATKPTLDAETQALISKLVIEGMAKIQAANAGDTQAMEDLAASSDYYDPNDILPVNVHYFTNQRLWLRNYRKNGREVKIPFGGEGFMFRLIDSRIEGPEKDKRELCIYSFFTKSKKEVEFLDNHPWYDISFWKDSRDAVVNTADEIMWQMDAFKRLESLSASNIAQEVKNLQEKGMNISMSPDLQKTRKQLLPIFVARLKEERSKIQINEINKMQVESNERERAEALAFG